MTLLRREIDCRGPAVLLLFDFETQRLPFDDLGHAITRSSIRNRKMRQTCERAMTNSTSGALFARASKLSRIIRVVAPYTAKMKGKPKRCL